MLILGIESSCDDTAAALVEDGVHVRSSVVSSQLKEHEAFGGVVPEIASRAHAELVMPAVRAAMRKACVSWSAIDAIAVGHRPGLIGSLLVGLAAAKALSWSARVPLIGVDHVHAHLYACVLDSTPAWHPSLGLVVSGGHSSLYLCSSPTSLVRLGGTIDDAVGEAYDKAALTLGLPFPGGPALDKLAQRGDPSVHTFPVSMLGKGSLDFSFSGLKTSLLYAVRGVPARKGLPALPARTHADLSGQQLADLAAGFQRAAVAAVTRKVSRALDSLCASPSPPRSLLVGGGVSANSLLRSRLTALAAERGLALRLAPLRYCVDNAAMLAGLGYHLLLDRGPDDLSLGAVPTTAC